MIAFAVEPMGRVLENPTALAPRGVGPEVLQQRPAPQPPLGRTLMAVQSSACVHQPAQAVHRTIRRVARAMASQMGISHYIRLCFIPQFSSIPHTEAFQVCVAHHC